MKENLLGLKFSRLLVIAEAPAQGKKKQTAWFCRCDCGKESIVIGSGLKNGHTTSCGCARIAGAIKTAEKMLSKNPKKASARHVYTNGYKDGNISFDDFLEISQLPCFYCGLLSKNSNVYNKYKKKILTTVLKDISLGDFFYNGLDRVDNFKPHNLDNVVPCCKLCNSAKMEMTSIEFDAWIERIYQTLQKRKGS